MQFQMFCNNIQITVFFIDYLIGEKDSGGIKTGYLTAG